MLQDQPATNILVLNALKVRAIGDSGTKRVILDGKIGE